MQAFRAANRYSCGLANLFDPPSSLGSLISIDNCRDTCSPPMAKLSTCDGLLVSPCKAYVTRNCVWPFVASCLMPSIRLSRSSILMSLRTRFVFSALTSMAVSLVSSSWNSNGSLECGERRLDARGLSFSDQTGEHLAEVGVLGP